MYEFVKHIIVLILFIPAFVFSQKIDKQQLVYKAIQCDIPIRKSAYPKSIPYEFKNSKENRTLNYSINYIADGVMLSGLTCSEWPADAKTALEYAMEIWSDVLENNQNIGIDACWTLDVGGNTLAQAGAFYTYVENFNALEPTYYPTALIEHIANQSISSTDIQSFFNANRTDWYFGTDANTPANMVDFVSVSVHELGHGLGFAGLHGIDDGVLDANMEHECDGVAGNGCIGFFWNGSFIPSIFDRFIDIDDESKIIALTNPSVAIATNLSGGSTSGGTGGLDFDETNESIYRRSGIKMHVPPTYQPGSSYSHFDEASLPNELMSPSFTLGQAIHDVGLAETVMLEMGWSAHIVPVELTSFKAQLSDEKVHLDWTTASELDNDHFLIEKSLDQKSFQSIGKVDGNGTSSSKIDYRFIDRNPNYGNNYYRLKQIDFNGAHEYSDVKVINYQGPIREVSISPNPVHDVLSINFNVDRNSKSIISIFETTGKLIRSLELDTYDSTFDIDIQDLAQGNYYIRINDGNSLITTNFVKMK